jgi:hypothetical protein
MASTTTSIPSVRTASATATVRSAVESVPWYVWCSVFAVSSAMIGGQWDISWHRSIGRDTFWTPAHMAIQLCGVLAGISCGYLILATTFGNFSRLRETSVKIWGLEGPLGAFIAAWGGLAMITSAPFDNWWHDAYGLDVKILSPPHVLLILGNLAVNTGTLILILGMMNRARGEFQSKLNALFLYVGGVVLTSLMLMVMEFSWHALMHSGVYYRVMCMVIPLIIAGVARASDSRWAATTVTAVYWLFWAGMGWILPLFPAEPKLGPVYHQTTQFVPPEFPMLLFIPALALDLLWSRTRHWNKWTLSAVSGLLFLGFLFAVQWPFSSFLLTPAARNWFFHTNIFEYFTRPTSINARYVMVPPDTPNVFWTQISLAAVFAFITMRLGIAWGDWMRRIRR